METLPLDPRSVSPTETINETHSADTETNQSLEAMAAIERIASAKEIANVKRKICEMRNLIFFTLQPKNELRSIRVPGAGRSLVLNDDGTRMECRLNLVVGDDKAQVPA